MTSQLKAPKKPFPIAGVFLILYALASLTNSLISLISFIFRDLALYLEYLGLSDVVINLILRIPPVLIGITALVLAIVLFIKRSGLSVAIALTAFAFTNCLQFLLIAFRNTEYIINNITVFIKYTEITNLFYSISSLSYVSELFFIALALIILTVIAFLLMKPERCKSFLTKLWVVSLVLFVISFALSGTSLVIDVISTLDNGYSLDIYYIYSSCATSFISFLALLAHMFLAIWFGRLASYRRKLQAYEAATPIETTAADVSEAPSLITETIPVSDSETASAEQ